MTQKIIKKIILHEKGSALVMTLGVLLILSILVISIGVLTIGSYRLSDANHDDTSAYYIAEAGAEMAYEEVYTQVLAAYDNPATENSFFEKVTTIMSEYKNKTYDNFEKQGSNSPSAIVDVLLVEEGTSRTYKISSTGHISNKKRIVEKKFVVSWVEKNPGGGFPSIPEGAALVAREKIHLLNGKIEGTAYIDSKEKKSVKLGNNNSWDKVTIVYPTEVSYENMLDDSMLINQSYYLNKAKEKSISKDVTIPWESYENLLGQELLEKIVILKKITNKLDRFNYSVNQNSSYDVIDYNGNLLLNSWMLNEYTLNLTTDIYIPKIDIASQKNLKINPNGGNHTILVDDLKIVSGSLDIIGKGTVTLVVTNSTFFNQISKINMSGTNEQLLLIYTGSSPNFSQITEINANIVVKGNKAPITINNSSINGLFITDSTKISYTGGNSGRPSRMMLIAPYSNVVLGSGYHINGTIIARKIILEGGGQMIFAPFENTIKQASSDDIITSSPIIEAE